MNHDHIRALLDVLAHGSVLGAARASGIARGTLRNRLSSLEAELGAPLLVRTSEGVVLTDAGSRALPYLRSILATEVDLRQDLEQHALGRTGELKVVMMVGGEPLVTAQVLTAARALLGGASVALTSAEDPLEAETVETDIVFHLGDPPADPRWYSRVVRRLTLGAFASPDYLSAQGTPASLAELRQHPLLLFQGPAWPHARIPTVDGPQPCTAAFRSVDIDLLRWMAALGHGIAILPDGGIPETPGRPPVVPVLPELVQAPMVLRASTRNRALPRVKRLLDAFEAVMPTSGG